MLTNSCLRFLMPPAANHPTNLLSSEEQGPNEVTRSVNDGSERCPRKPRLNAHIWSDQIKNLDDVAFDSVSIKTPVKRAQFRSVLQSCGKRSSRRLISFEGDDQKYRR